MYSCTPSSSTTPSVSSTDTTFTGSYIDLNYSGKYIKLKELTFSKPYYYQSTIQTILVPGYNYQIIGVNDAQIGGLTRISLVFQYSGTGVGTYPTFKAVPTTITTGTSTYNDTSGTVTIDHNGADYLGGTFSVNMYGSGLTIPATGSFKIIR